MLGDNKDVAIAFWTGGGAGSLFVQANFLYCYRQYFSQEKIKIIVFGHKSDELNQLIFGTERFVDEVYNYSKRVEGYKYDACVQLIFYPEVLFETERVKDKSPRLHALLKCWKAFMSKDSLREFCMQNPHYDSNAYIYGIINGKNNLNLMDIDGIIGVRKKYSWKLRLEDNESYLKMWELKPGEYITVQRGATPGMKLKESPKLWPVHHYEELIRLLKIMYPNKKIVQVGEVHNSEPLAGVDIDLLGKTTWKQLGHVLKSAWLHIDGECGMVHFREALGAGPSVVLFGATPLEFYGYENNINIKSNVCAHWCARLTDTWQKYCARGYAIPLCMDSIKPMIVLGRILAWDILTNIKNGDCNIEFRLKNRKLYTDTSILLDDTYKKLILEQTKVYHYEIENIQVNQLQAHVMMADDKFDYVMLEDTPAYAMAQGDKEVYRKYIEKLNNGVHSVLKFEQLLKDMEQQGYDARRYIVTDEDNKILDGMHRAAWIMARKGKDTIVPVLKIFRLNEAGWGLFPFEKIKKDSNIIIYGAGAWGASFIKQIKYTKYCNIVGLLDRAPENWNMVEAKRMEMECKAIEEIINYSKDKYDYIVLATGNYRFASEMENILQHFGVEMNKIVSACWRKLWN